MKETRYMAYTKANYRFQLAENLVIKTSVTPPATICHQFFTLATDGWLIIKKGYAWDGISFFLSPQTTNSRKGTCVHDCFYQMMRLGLLDLIWKPWTDEEMRRVFIASGMFAWRANYMYQAVLKFGAPNVDPKNARPILLAA